MESDSREAELKADTSSLQGASNRMERPARPTIKDVARAAGVSAGVVSTVLSGTNGSAIRVSAQTSERIRSAARALGYRPNALARALQRRRTQTLLLAVYFLDSLTKVPILAEILDGTLNRAVSRGYDVTIHMVRKEDGEKPGVLGDGRSDGCIWVAPWIDDAALPHEGEPVPSVDVSGAPLVVLCARVQGGASCVVADNRGGVTALVDHLSALGHRNLAFVEHPLSWMTHDCRERRAAFLDLCAARNLGGRVVYLDDLTSVLREDPASRPTGVIGWNDELALLAGERVRGEGLSIPDDISIAGFDSTSLCETWRPRLTSVHQPIHVMAEKAVDLLVNQIEGVTFAEGDSGVATPDHIHVFPCRLDVRDSTGPAPR